MISLLHSVAVFAFTGTAWVAWSAAAAGSALIKRQSTESFRVRMSRKIAPVIAKAKWNFFGLCGENDCPAPNGGSPNFLAGRRGLNERPRFHASSRRTGG